MRTRILVLEQTGSLARSMAGLLSAQQYGVQVAPPTVSSLGLLATFRPDLVVLDVQRPCDWELLYAVRSQSDVPVIVCGSNCRGSDAARCLRSGADDFVLWPGAPEELAARVEAHLRRAAWQAQTR